MQNAERKETPVTMGLRIASRRTLLDMSGGQLADAVGVSREWISAIENGRTTRLSAMVLMKIAETLGVTETWILRGDSESTASAA